MSYFDKKSKYFYKIAINDSIHMYEIDSHTFATGDINFAEEYIRRILDMKHIQSPKDELTTISGIHIRKKIKEFTCII